MSDILDRARQAQHYYAEARTLSVKAGVVGGLFGELADEIERLRARLSTVEALLEDADPDWEDRPR